MNNQINESLVYIRAYDPGERIWTNEGYMELPNISYKSREFKDQDDPDYLIEIFHGGRWLQVQNIDFE